MVDPANQSRKPAGQNDNDMFTAGPAVLAAVTIRLAAEARRLKLLTAVYYLEMAAQHLIGMLKDEEQRALEQLNSKVSLNPPPLGRNRKLPSLR